MAQRVRCIILDPSGRLLLGRNKANYFNLPGGKIDKGEHPVDALLREIREETGITKFKKLKYLWDQDDNKVFVLQPKGRNKPTAVNDPDKEFFAFGWFDPSNLPGKLNPYAKSILHRYLNTTTAGVIEVLVDGKKVYDLEDDMVWETMPRVVQKIVNEGKKVEFKQILDDGTVIDKTPEVFPDYMKAEGDGNLERAIQMKRIYETIDELLLRYIPEEKTRPSAEIIYDVDYLGKTTWKPMGGKNYTHISVNHKIVDNPDLLRQVLAHEIIHHHLYKKYGKEVAKHGEHFEMLADKINAKEGSNFVTEFANQTDFKEGNSK